MSSNLKAIGPSNNQENSQVPQTPVAQNVKYTKLETRTPLTNTVKSIKLRELIDSNNRLFKTPSTRKKSQYSQLSLKNPQQTTTSATPLKGAVIGKRLQTPCVKSSSHFQNAPKKPNNPVNRIACNATHTPLRSAQRHLSGANNPFAPQMQEIKDGYNKAIKNISFKNKDELIELIKNSIDQKKDIFTAKEIFSKLLFLYTYRNENWENLEKVINDIVNLDEREDKNEVKNELLNSCKSTTEAYLYLASANLENAPNAERVKEIFDITHKAFGTIIENESILNSYFTNLFTNLKNQTYKENCSSDMLKIQLSQLNNTVRSGFASKAQKEALLQFCTDSLENQFPECQAEIRKIIANCFLEEIEKPHLAFSSPSPAANSVDELEQSLGLLDLNPK